MKFGASKKTATRKKRLAQSLVEYGLILALVSVVAIAVLNTMGKQIQGTVAKVNGSLGNATCGAGKTMQADGTCQ